jgi:hypothetical protein
MSYYRSSRALFDLLEPVMGNTLSISTPLGAREKSKRRASMTRLRLRLHLLLFDPVLPLSFYTSFVVHNQHHTTNIGQSMIRPWSWIVSFSQLDT